MGAAMGLERECLNCMCWIVLLNLMTKPEFMQAELQIILPQKALESLIQAHASAALLTRTPSPQELANYDPTSWEPSPFDRQHPSKPHELPSPLTFQIRNPTNRVITHGGVREFSANDNTVHLPTWMMTSLDLSVSDQVMVKFQDLPKGLWAKFRPLTTDYTEIVDFRAAFEAFLRSHYNTLTAGEVLTIEQAKRSYQFAVEDLKPAKAVCITDTDLEVDIEPLDTDMQDTTDRTGSVNHDSKVKIAKEMKDLQLRIGTESSGTVGVDSYQRWKIDVPNRKSGVQIIVDVQEPGDLDVLISTRSPVTLQDHIWSNFESLGPRIVTIPASDQDYATQEDSHLLHIGIYGRAPSVKSSGSSAGQTSVSYSIRVQYNDDEPLGTMSTSATSDAPSTSTLHAQLNENTPGYQPCTNCGSWIPERTMMLHANFCLRNNTRCNKCGEVMKKEDAASHYHCEHCDKHGDISEEKKHMEIYHGWYQCSCESFESPRLPDLALHRRTDCSERFIICRYCHTMVQQGTLSSNARDRIRGLHSHESYCGDRTIQCQKCTLMVSLKDIQVHAKNHEYQRQNQSTPKLCTNENCVRPRSTNVLGLCQLCFGPYWVPTEDHKHQKLVQRLARKYHSQLMTGCGNSWCRNMYCATSRGQQMDATSAATELMVILKDAKIGSSTETGKLWLCVDEGTTRKKVLAQVLFEDMQGQYALEWCVKALENERTDLEAAIHDDYWVWAKSTSKGWHGQGKTGKWMLFYPKPELDAKWAIIQKLVEQDILGGLAKCSTSKENDKAKGFSTGVIIIYTPDYRDQEDVYRVATVLHEVMAYKNTMYYKTDEQTNAGLYAKNGNKVNHLYKYPL
ncbi:hypothetical protein BG004_004225 [Podila humilis]|nr:hypothetical protein BG004_004225 [Podila humilis]